MKKFVLAAIAALSLGIGSAYAMQPLTSHLGQTINGPAYSDDFGQRPIGRPLRQVPLQPANTQKGSAKRRPLLRFGAEDLNRRRAASLRGELL